MEIFTLGKFWQILWWLCFTKLMTLPTDSSTSTSTRIQYKWHILKFLYTTKITHINSSLHENWQNLLNKNIYLYNTIRKLQWFLLCTLSVLYHNYHLHLYFVYHGVQKKFKKHNDGFLVQKILTWRLPDSWGRSIAWWMHCPWWRDPRMECVPGQASESSAPADTDAACVTGSPTTHAST